MLQRVKAGADVRVVLPEGSLRCGAGDEYPNMGTGRVKEFVPGERLALVNLNKPFMQVRTNEKGRKAFNKVAQLYIPVWLLEEVS